MDISLIHGIDSDFHGVVIEGTVEGKRVVYSVDTRIMSKELFVALIN